jgi:hypothetical protein
MRGGTSKAFRGKRAMVAIAAVTATLVAVPVALAHIERASYWPNPAAEKLGKTTTGGKVPTVRPLFKALANKKTARNTHVVCQGKVPKKPKKGASEKKLRKYNKAVMKNKSMKRLNKTLKKAVFNKNKKKRGYVLRPSEPKVKVKQKYGEKLRKFNAKLLQKCKFDSVQDAVDKAGNNDRVIVMPGVYTEPDSRSAPTNDPKCDGLEETNDRGQTGALSYRYQLSCPNDQNLVAVLGREPGATPPPQPPNPDRHGIPDEGSCIRCNLQLEGSGLTPDDVVLDAGNVAAGNGGPPNPVKDVVVRADRADGFVLRNMNLRHAAEHGIYVLETDGYLLEDFKTFHNEEYGVLTFTSDHGVMQDCDAAGSGDAALYPGSAPDTGEQVRAPDTVRYNTEITRCDMRHSTIGYSGTSANAVWMHHNDFYDNALGFSTDVFTAAGHPGFPQDSDLIENNEIYSNNFNPYLPGSDVVPTLGVPVGVGGWIAGGNNNTFRNNHFWDNWRRGFMLFAVPDIFVCPPGDDDQIPGCDPTEANTAFRNRFHGNKMGVAPAGAILPNGVDFVWDENKNGFNPAENSANCWFDNTGKDGTAASVTSEPASLPSDCSNSPGGGLPPSPIVSELITCSTLPDGDPGCPWYTTPPKPTP